MVEQKGVINLPCTDFADDIAILAEEENICQEMTTKLEEHSAQVGLNISREKTKAMGITQLPSPPPIAVVQGNIEYLPGYLPGVATPGRDVESQSDEAMRLGGTSP